MTPRIVLVGVFLVLAACGHSSPTQFLTLDPTPGISGAGADYLGPAIRVPAVHIPPALDREEFVQKTSPGELKVDDFVRWSAPLGMLARNTLILDLSSRLPAGRVAPPDAPAQSAGLRIDVVILSLEVANGEASMRAAYEFAADDGEIPATFRQWTNIHSPSGGQTGLDAARDFSALLGQLADQICLDLTRRP